VIPYQSKATITQNYYMFVARRVCKPDQLATKWVSVRPSVYMELLESYWRKHHEIWYMVIEKFARYFTQKHHAFMHQNQVKLSQCLSQRKMSHKIGTA